MEVISARRWPLADVLGTVPVSLVAVFRSRTAEVARRAATSRAPVDTDQERDLVSRRMT